MERALCRVTGGDCLATELAACTVRSAETGGKLGVKLTFIKLGGSLSLLREQLSDGTVDITLIDGADVAPTAALGASGGIRLGGDRLGGGAITKAELLVRLGRRRVWHRRDGASADRLVRDIREHVAANVGERLLPVVGSGARRLAHAVGLDGDRLPTPDVSGVSAGLEGVVEAQIAGGTGVEAALRGSLGGTRDRRTGRRTLVLSLAGDGTGMLAAATGGAGLSGSGGATLTLTYDRRGEPIELAVAVAGVGRGNLGIDLRRHEGRDGDGGRVEIAARLDLAREANRATYDRLLAALSPAGGRDLPGALAALAHQLETAARRDVVRYDSAATIYGAEAEAAVGARVGGEVEISRTTSQLRDAWTRPAGGAWEQRTDCLRSRSPA
ncbi:MAG: hypothetical protein M3364_03630, partial [Actinomycetota bacterium]|nr:hypothetical protein [Actinomycetota bacterium]